jgi:hypothetical protein
LYVWHFSDKTPSRTVTTIQNSWPAAGSYWISLTVIDAGGLTHTFSQSVIVP